MLNLEIIEIIKDGFSINDVCNKVYGYCNGNTIKKIKSFIELNDLDISHFENKNKNIKYERIIKKCKVCCEPFETLFSSKREKIFCSISCSNSFRVSSSETKEKISNGLKIYHQDKNNKRYKNCVICDNVYEVNKVKCGVYSKSKTCSKTCNYKLRSELSRDSVNKRIQLGTHKGWQSRKIESFPEKFFKRVLDSNGIFYEFNKPVRKRDIGIDCDSNYFLDFYIPDCNIDLEIDGKQHEYRNEHDKIRDLHISKKYRVYRIKWKSINSNFGKNYIKGEIEKFLLFYKSLK